MTTSAQVQGAPGLPEISQGFPPRQVGDPLPVPLHKGHHPVWIGPGIFPERPTDPYAQEEVFVVEVGDHGVV